MPTWKQDMLNAMVNPEVDKADLARRMKIAMSNPPETISPEQKARIEAERRKMIVDLVAQKDEKIKWEKFADLMRITADQDKKRAEARDELANKQRAIFRRIMDTKHRNASAAFDPSIGGDAVVINGVRTPLNDLDPHQVDFVDIVIYEPHLWVKCHAEQAADMMNVLMRMPEVRIIMARNEGWGGPPMFTICVGETKPGGLAAVEGIMSVVGLAKT